jgi:hypothetical protein
VCGTSNVLKPFAWSSLIVLTKYATCILPPIELPCREYITALGDIVTTFFGPENKPGITSSDADGL